jgi:hypothetical protein
MRRGAIWSEGASITHPRTVAARPCALSLTRATPSSEEQLLPPADRVGLHFPLRGIVDQRDDLMLELVPDVDGKRNVDTQRSAAVSSSSPSRLRPSRRATRQVPRPNRTSSEDDRTRRVSRSVRLTILPFSGGRERERSDRRARPLQRRVGRRATCGHVVGALARERLIETKLTAGRERCG